MTVQPPETQLPGDHLRNEAIRRIRWPFLLVTLVVLAVLAFLWSQFGPLVPSVIVSIAAAVLAVLWLITRMRNLNRTFITGAEAEELVGQRLQSLVARGWRFLNNVPKPGGGDVDHVLWGPKGIFVIETKAHRGAVALESGRLTFNRTLPRADFVQQTYANTLYVRDLLCEKLGRRVWIVSVLCLTDAFIESYRIDLEHPPVHVVKVERLIEFVEGYRSARSLAPEDIERIGQVLDPSNRN